MGSSGLEPPTSRLSGVRSNHLSYEPISWSYELFAFFTSGRLTFVTANLLRNWVSSPSTGGDKRDRTADPLLAKQVLSQLSYTPISFGAYLVLDEPQKLNNDSKRILQSVSTLLTLEF